MKINFSRVFASLVDRFGDRAALVNTERDRQFTYRQLHSLTNQIARMLSERLQLGADDRYLLILLNDNLSLMHVWTSLKSEAAAVFTNAGDSIDEHLRQIDFVQARCVFIESTLVDKYLEQFRARGLTVVAMDGAPDGCSDVHDFWELLRGVSDADWGREREANDQCAFYRFTGGTTGVPKCAVYAYRHFEYLWDSFTRLDDDIFNPSTRLLHLTPLSHGTLFTLAPTFYSGGCNFTQNHPDLLTWCRNVERFKINTGFFVPTLLYRLLTLTEARARDLSSLSTLIYGAAPMSPSKLSDLQNMFGNIFVQVYGATESFGAVTYLSKADHCGEGREARLASCGRAVRGAELIAADDQGREVKRGEVGELWHRHKGVISGYLANPEATGTEFVDGWWRSGDLGCFDVNGYCTIVDRRKDMIITGGFNVYAIEVESALTSHPAVLMCAVVGVPHADWGEAILAEVVLRPQQNVGEDELIAHAKRVAGSYKAPKRIVFVDQLPLSSVGKVIRKDVRNKYWSDQMRQVN
jgi:fatty-acyl-CoA synthase